jgi:hypothetical protein
VPRLSDFWPPGKTQEDAATPTLIVEQARALVEAEEGRFVALQTQATTILAVIGVVASIGATFLAGFHGHRYEVVVHVLGLSISLVLIAAIVIGSIAIVGLLVAGVFAIGALRTDPDPARHGLVAVVDAQFPGMLEDRPAQSAHVLLTLFAHQLAVRQKANARVREGLRLAITLLGLAVVSGLALAVLLTAGTASTVQETHLINTTAKAALTVKGVR